MPEVRSYIPGSILDKLPTMVKIELLRMPADRQELFLEGFRRKSKSVGLTYFFWLIVGLHYIYLGKLGWQLLYWVTGAGLGIWALVDLFRIPGMVREYNKDIATDVLRDLKIISAE